MPVSLKIAVVALTLSVSCLWGAVQLWRTGVGSLLARHARQSLLPEQADRAVDASPTDPETRLARAVVLYNLNDTRGALEEFERAAALRPRDYLLWLQLGRARDESGEREKALEALRESIRLAPFYAEPRWQHGNLLHRLGRYEEAFAELRNAARSDPALFPVLLDLAWGTYQGAPGSLEQAALPRTDAERLGLARFLLKKGRLDEATGLVRALGTLSDKDRGALVKEMLVAGQYGAAYETWARGREPAGEAKTGVAQITDPGFEGRVNPHETGFGWRQERVLEGVILSVDAKVFRTGSRSLSIEWAGHAEPPAHAITQLVLVEPGTRYTLRFYARTEKLIAGGLPILVVSDGAGEGGPVLAQSKPLPPEAPEWQADEVSFTTANTTRAVSISLARLRCQAGPCPMFGRVWLDDFSLRKS
jgi:tetratricopeptide (TPR) repeat protein